MEENSIKKLTDIKEETVINYDRTNLLFFDDNKGLRRIKLGNVFIVPHLVDFHLQEENFCKTWSNGWLEQGGKLPRNSFECVFRKPFKNKKYTLYVTNNTNEMVLITQKTEAGFRVGNYKNYPITWFAFGTGV